jgi:8-oxo-dGTP diphosphatase
MAKQSQYIYDYPRPRVATDIVVLANIDDETNVLLIRRGNEPYQGDWALPGGFVDENESLKACAERELQEETGVTGIALEQFYTYGDPGRDPRGWSLSIAFWGVVKGALPFVEGADDAVEAAWYPLDALPPLAFDHDDMIAHATRLS